MARLIGILNEGSLLRRTLVWVGTFAVGSVAVVALASFLLVTIAKAVLPSRATAAEQAKEKAKEGEAESAEEAPTAGGKAPALKVPRAIKRARTAPAPAEDDGAND